MTEFTLWHALALLAAWCLIDWAIVGFVMPNWAKRPMLDKRGQRRGG